MDALTKTRFDVSRGVMFDISITAGSASEVSTYAYIIQ